MSEFDENWIWPYQNEAQDLRNSISTTKISQIPKIIPKIAKNYQTDTYRINLSFRYLIINVPIYKRKSFSNMNKIIEKM